MLIELIKSRRSIRSFCEKPVSKELLLSLVEAARWAPSGSNKQPWLFVIVQKPANIQKIKMFSPGLHGSPAALIVLCEDTSIDGTSHVMDIAMAAQNILLAATDMGLGSCPIRSFNQAALRTLLSLPLHFVPQLIVSLGYSTQSVPVPPRRSIEDVVLWERYGG